MTTDEVKMLIFGLDGEKYSTDIKEVERILGYEEPTLLPDAPSFVKGVINYEDGILPIISLSEKFNLGLDKESDTRQIIVVKRQEKKFGIIVENVYEVRDIDESLIEEAPAILAVIFLFVHPCFSIFSTSKGIAKSANFIGLVTFLNCVLSGSIIWDKPATLFTLSYKAIPIHDPSPIVIISPGSSTKFKSAIPTFTSALVIFTP